MFQVIKMNLDQSLKEDFKNDCKISLYDLYNELLLNF